VLGFKISLPVVGSRATAQAAEISAQAAIMEDPTISAKEHMVKPVTVPLNMITSPYAYHQLFLTLPDGATYDEDDGEVLEDCVDWDSEELLYISMTQLRQ
jgi:hypothetical protein